MAQKAEEATDDQTVGATLRNATSSRAHTVVTIEFKQLEMIRGSKSVKIFMIHVVHLAGIQDGIYIYIYIYNLFCFNHIYIYLDI